MEGVPRGIRRAWSPNLIDHDLGGDDRFPMDEEHGERGTSLDLGDGDLPSTTDDAQRTEGSNEQRGFEIGRTGTIGSGITVAG